MGVDIEEYPFIFMNTPASLQILASVEMALMVWRCKYANTGHLYEKPSLCFMKQKFSCSDELVVPVPHRIRAQIDEKIATIGQDLRKWIDLHSYLDFLDADSTEGFRRCFKHIAVDFSGSVGCKASAINMLNSGEFNDVVNYKIACTFCLEDQVKRCWPSVANKSRIDVNNYYICDKLNLYYWNGLMKSGGNSITGTISVMELVKITACRGIDAAFDYFCKILPDHEKVSAFISLLLKTDDRYHPAVVHSLLFRTLDRLQAEEAFKKTASSIFKVLTKNDKNFGYAHQLWTLMGHLILENESQFYNVVYELWALVFFSHHSHGLNYKQYGQINNLLLEIWSDASDELKTYVSNKFSLGHLFSYRENERPIKFPKSIRYGHDMTFILEITSKWSGEDKVQLWQQYWRQLAVRSKPVYLEQFMRMCLPNDDAIELFKIEIANFKNIFRSLIEEGFYSDLNDYVKFCTKDAKQFQQLGKKVLGSNLRFILIHDDDKFAKFEWFVSEVFANVQKDIEEFKTKMISSADCMKFLLAPRKADEAISNDFSRIISRFVTDERKLQQVKRKLVEHCRTYPAKCTLKVFNADQWQEFLGWCTADREEIAGFKRSLNVDVIFLKRLKSYLDAKCFVEGLHFLDNFLKWYFENEEDAKNFKLEKAKNYKEIDILRVEMENHFIYVEGLLYRLLVWLFDKNTENVDEFLKTCNINIRRRQIKARKRT